MADATATEKTNKETDITIYGATSCTARHVIIYLIQSGVASSAKLRLTFAGRNLTKLKMLKESFETKLHHLHVIHSEDDGSDTDISIDTFVAESSDTPKLKHMAERTCVVLNCAGPFNKYGTHVVEACALVGTDYVDITGEVTWAGNMRLKYGPAAQKSGARIISFCGFDSVPSDLAVLAAVDALRKKAASASVQIQNATTWYDCMGFASGGTVQTVLDMPIDLSKTLWRRVPFLLDDPLVLTHPKIRTDPAMNQTRDRMAWGEWMNQLPAFHTIFRFGASAPFLMAPCNAKVIYASAVALNYGSEFSYRERYLPVGFQMTTGIGTLSLIPALLTQFFTYLLGILLKTPVLGTFLANTFIPAGTGSSDQVCQAGHAQVYAQVETAPNETTGLKDRANCLIQFEGDPGNFVTAQCVAEAALALVYNRSLLPKRSQDGFGTPAELLGLLLLQRLQQSPIRKVEVYTHARRAVSGPEWRMFP